MLDYAVPRHAMPFYACIFNTMLCHVMLCAAVRCHASRCNTFFPPQINSTAKPKHTMPVHHKTDPLPLVGAIDAPIGNRLELLWSNSSLRNTTPCYDILSSTVLFYAMLCRPLPCSAYLLGIIALLDIRLCEYRGDLRHGKGWEGGVGRQI